MGVPRQVTGLPRILPQMLRSRGRERSPRFRVCNSGERTFVQNPPRARRMPPGAG